MNYNINAFTRIYYVYRHTYYKSHTINKFSSIFLTENLKYVSNLC